MKNIRKEQIRDLFNDLYKTLTHSGIYYWGILGEGPFKLWYFSNKNYGLYIEGFRKNFYYIKNYIQYMFNGKIYIKCYIPPNKPTALLGQYIFNLNTNIWDIYFYKDHYIINHHNEDSGIYKKIIPHPNPRYIEDEKHLKKNKFGSSHIYPDMALYNNN